MVCQKLDIIAAMFEQKLYAICHNIRSLHNVGSIFRTADAAGVDKIFLCGYTGQPPRKEISKVSLGAEESVPWEHHYQTWRVVENLKSLHVQIVALENNIGFYSQNFQEFKPRFPTALLIGNEVTGLSEGLLKRADSVVSIPMFGQKESLNVSVAFGIALFELNRHRR
ncbi:RNA methyltransferase [Candidatus Acetothermia bacterium]|nr:RNA methyltransferase [Candidatus Acetothermia bacterium]MBI3643535.1 RNA methyltransferase [Candidatus Acetothermia bacterium]